MRTVVFDLDGTLADTSGDLIAAANTCFQGLGHGDLLDPVADAGTAFYGGRAMLRLGFERLGQVDEQHIENNFAPFVEAYEANIDTHSYLYPGAMEAVKKLSDDGYIVAICTNKPEYLARLLLGRMGVLDAFASLTGADTLPIRKPDPEHLFETVRRAGGDPKRCLLVGDTSTDRDTSRAAGVPSILVTFGPNAGTVAAMEPEAIIDHFDELHGVVQRLIG